MDPKNTERVSADLCVAILFAGFISRQSGTSERVYQVATELTDLGVHVTLSGSVSNCSDAPKRKNLQTLAMPSKIPGTSTVMRAFGYLKWFVRLIASVSKRKCDVIQIEAFPLSRSLLLLLCLRPFGKRFVIVFHDRYFEKDPCTSLVGRLQLVLQRILLKLFDVAVTPGESVKEWFKELQGETAETKIMVIPNGAPDLAIKPADRRSLRKKYGIDTNGFIALFFGSMAFKPNVEAALHLHQLSDSISRRFEALKRKRLFFIVAGIGTETLHRADHFIPLGFVEELSELFSLPDAIVLPHTSSYSGPHIKTMYAFLSGKPVVATEDAIKDMPFIIEKKHFLLFDINKPDSLLSALVDLYDDKKLSNTLSTNAVRYARNFSWNRTTLLHMKLYKLLLGKL